MFNIVFTKKRIKRSIFLLRELMYRIRYGSRAPKYAERIYVNPQIIQQFIFGPTNFVSCSGSVININKKYKIINIYQTPRIKSSIDHWVYGVPWESTDDYKIMLNAIKNGKIWAGCKNEIDLRLRFEQLRYFMK